MEARYDGVADWYEHEFRDARLSGDLEKTAIRLLGTGPGQLLDVGCGTGRFTAIFAGHDWTVTGIDVSEDMLQRARDRGLDVRLADATALPFSPDSFDAAISMWTHTDIDDFGAAVREVARVRRAGGTFVYMGAHPCFVGPRSAFVAAEGVPTLHPGYRVTGRYVAGPGVTADGLRAKVGATHLPLGLLMQRFCDADFHIEDFEESTEREYPYMIGMRCRL
jgi:SAM-dependent methyltransferase